MHCGCKVYKMAAKVEKFRRLYALFFNRYSSFLKDVLSVRLRSNLPAGHSMHSLASEEALTNHPSVHGSNLYSPTLLLANPDCLKAGSSWSLTPYN